MFTCEILFNILMPYNEVSAHLCSPVYLNHYYYLFIIEIFFFSLSVKIYSIYLQQLHLNISFFHHKIIYMNHLSIH